MKLSFFGIKASTLCVGGSLLLLGGFMSVNLAGCGGGGGGGGTSSVRVNATFQLTLQGGDAASNATLVLLKGSKIVVNLQADDNGIVQLDKRIAPGTYTYQLTLEGESEPSTGTITILAVDNQTYTIYEGNGGNDRFRISGTVFLNPSGLDDPDGDQNTPNCSTTSDPVTAPLTILIRDLEAPGEPIIAQYIRGLSESGGYTLTLPRRPTLFRVEVSEGTDEGEQYAGRSGQTTFPSTVTTLTGIDICANDTNTAPVASTPTPTNTPTPTPESTATATATAAP